MRGRLAGAGLVLLIAAALACAAATARPSTRTATAEGARQTKVTVTRAGGAYPQLEFNLDAEGGTASATAHFGTTPSTITFTWVLPKEIPAAGAKGSLTIAVHAGSERFAPAMAIQSPMVSCDSVKIPTGNTCTTGGTVQIGGVAEKGESQTFSQAFTLKGPAADIQLGIQDGPMVTYTYAASTATTPAASAPCTSRQLQGISAINELRVLCVTPDCAFTRDDPSDWQPLEAGMVMKPGDQISCDPDGTAVVAYADNSSFTIRHTTLLSVSSFFTEGGVIRLEILLKMGEVAAKVNKSEATKSDFQIKSPTATASVRGTIFSVFFDPVSKVSLTSVTRGVVEVDPAKAGLATANVPAGKEVQVTESAISPTAPLGKAGAVGGIDIVKARDLVMAKVAAGNGPCGLVLPRTGAFSVKPTPTGWLVAVKATAGKAKGWSIWLVSGSKVSPQKVSPQKVSPQKVLPQKVLPQNDAAKAIAARCG